MPEVAVPRPKRKTLSLKRQSRDDARCEVKAEKAVAELDDVKPPKFLTREQSVFMVWCPEGEMPKRVYQPEEAHIAYGHARQLCEQTGKTFYVMRSWRGFEAK